MESTFITEVLNGNINYIAIKLIEKQTNNTKDVKSGLFKGVVIHKDTDNKEHTFILTEQTSDKNKSIINGLNIKYYDILAILIVNNICKVNIFATKTEKDQKRIYNVLELCLETLITDNMMEEDFLVNTALYTSVPTSISKKKVIVDTACHNSYANIYKSKQKEGPQPIFFKSKNINIKEIKDMRSKLDLILTKAFIPVMPETKSGEEEKTVVKKSACYGYGCGYGYG